ncbi:hypothetical protein INR49_005005, partial [Caranx melampygus]
MVLHKDALFGETQYNRDKLLQGVDTPLSETGVQQGEAVGQYLQDITFNHVFASNLQRAVQTAEIILRNNTHCSGMEMVLEPFLRERGFGIAEGRPKEDLKNMANAAGQSCRDYTPPGGETLDQGLSVHALVVSHGAYIRVAIRHLVEDLKCSLPPGVKTSQLFSPCPNTGISRFILTLSQSECGPVLSAARCVFTNRKDHLENLPPV